MDAKPTMNAIKSFNPAMHWLQIRLTLMRWGWSHAVATLLCIVGLLGWGWIIPRLQAQDEKQKHLLMRANTSLASRATPKAPLPRAPSEVNLANFIEILGDSHYTEQQIKTLFAIAGKTGLSLHQAEYKSTLDPHGRFQTYQILLPVQGGYGAIRAFCEQTLLAIPFASLDEISFKRDGITNRTLEAKLRFTLYLNVAP